MSKMSYQSLIKMLDSIRREAPNIEEFNRYRSPNPKDVDFSRGQAYIHLLLLAKFGLDDFITRHEFITEGTGDGGLDAYYIDERNFQVFLIQSKFKTSATGFRTDETSAVELNQMSIDQILSGKDKDVSGVTFNEKVKKFQARFSELIRKFPYETKVLFLANIAEMTDEQIRRFTAGKDYEIYNYERSYLELVKSICSATYYDSKSIRVSFPIDINLTSGLELCKTVKTSFGKIELSAYFVPTIEIGKFLAKYKNAVLEFNPRNYLGLSDKKESVNSQIRETILDPKKGELNDFSLLNNGITILASGKNFSKESGVENTAFLHLSDPQIINGGQTAYTLSELFISHKNNLEVFKGKEVIVRIVVPITDKQLEIPEKKYRMNLIETVSYATNFQNPVKEPDRRSNSYALHLAQEEIFRKFGRLVEVKRGEFYEGIKKDYVSKDMIINRIEFMRAYLAFCKSLPNTARNASESRIFEKNFFSEYFEKDLINNPEQVSAEIYFAIRTYRELNRLDKEVKSSSSYGNALRYGKYAVLCAASLSLHRTLRENLTKINEDEVDNQVKILVSQVLSRWIDFEKEIRDLDKYPENKSYIDDDGFDFDNYYKGKALNLDIRKFNWSKKT